MKKFLSITGYILLYLFVLIGFTLIIPPIWVKLLPKEFAYQNYIIANFITFLFILLTYGFIFKLRKINWIKFMNFSKPSGKNFLLVLTTGILMGVFTACLCNTSFVLKGTPVFENYLSFVIDYSKNFGLFLVMVAFTFAFEELIFRGTMYNEIRSGVSLYPAIFISVAVYGIVNGLAMGFLIGIYATVASFFYTLAYVYTRTVWSPIMLQIASIYVISIFRKTGTWKWLGTLDGGILIAAIIVIAVSMLVLYYFMYQDYRKFNAGKDAAISATA